MHYAKRIDGPMMAILPIMFLLSILIVSFTIVGCASLVRESAARRAHVDAVLMGVE